jgi:ElaA protein
MRKKAPKILWTILHFNDLSIQQLFDLLKLRTEVFVVEQNCPYQEVDDKDLSAYHIMGYSNKKELIAIARILPKGISYAEISIGRVAVKQAHRNKGLAHELNERSIRFIENRLLATSIRLSAQSHLRSFYEKHRFKVVSEEYLEDGIPHVEMLRSTS